MVVKGTRLDVYVKAVCKDINKDIDTQIDIDTDVYICEGDIDDDDYDEDDNDNDDDDDDNNDDDNDRFIPHHISMPEHAQKCLTKGSVQFIIKCGYSTMT